MTNLTSKQKYDYNKNIRIILNVDEYNNIGFITRKQRRRHWNRPQRSNYTKKGTAHDGKDRKCSN